jgi:hypothetical protein
LRPTQKNASSHPIATRFRAVEGFSIALFLLCLVGQSLYCFMRPAGPFDTIVYVSLLDGGDQQVYREAAANCPAQLPGPHNGCDVTGSSYKEIASYTPSEYQTFLRFYRIKPLYTGTALLLHRALHLPSFLALRFVSALSFFIVGVTLAFWLKHHLSIPVACFAALMIVSFPQVITIGKFLLPDMFSVALMLACLYAILYLTGRLWVQLVLLALLPLARPDNIILSLMFGGILLYRATPDRKQLMIRLSALFLACAGLNILFSKLTHALPYTVLFNHSFLNFSRPSQYSSMSLSPHDYAHTILASAPKAIILFFPLPLFFTALTLIDRNSWQPLRDLVLAAMVSSFARLPLFPAEEERYYTWWLVIAAAAAAATLGQRMTAKSYGFVPFVSSRRGSHEPN